MLVSVLAAGARDAFEFEMVLVGEDEDLVIDYIIEAGDLAWLGCVCRLAASCAG